MCCILRTCTCRSTAPHSECLGSLVKFSMWLWPYARWGGFEGYSQAARRIEELGFDSVTVSDHTLSPLGEQPEALQREWPDWSVMSAFLLTATERLRVVSCVVIPHRQPISVAKQISTLDQLSRGRFTLAATIGWWPQEFAILGADFHRRGKLTDEYLDVMRTLWTQETPVYRGETVTISDVLFEPKCYQSPNVPIWIAGGMGSRVFERLVRLGDGWMPMGDDQPQQLVQTITYIKDLVGAAGRSSDDSTFRYTIGVGEAERSLGLLGEAIADAGSDWLHEILRNPWPWVAVRRKSSRRCPSTASRASTNSLSTRPAQAIPNAWIASNGLPPRSWRASRAHGKIPSAARAQPRRPSDHNLVSIRKVLDGPASRIYSRSERTLVL